VLPQFVVAMLVIPLIRRLTWQDDLGAIFTDKPKISVSGNFGTKNP
jgi:hypothetical protein